MNGKRTKSILGVLGVLAANFCFSHAQAEAFPSKTVRIVVPYPISGPTDIRGTPRMTRTYRMIAQNAPPAISDTLARTVAHAIRVETRQPVRLERQPGGVTTRGAMAVARSPADGHTLLIGSNATMIINPHYFYGVQYDPLRDFVLVAPLATMPFVLLVNSGLPVESPQQLVRWLKRRPGEVNYGSSGDGSTGHLAGEIFRRAAGVNVVHVSYNGGVAGLNDLASGQVSLMFAALPLALPYLSNEHFRVLGVASASRLVLLPELPTLAESGLPGFELEGWYGVFAPARTSPAAAVWLNERISAAVSEPATRFRLIGIGLEPAAVPLGRFATRINNELDRWAPVLRAARLPLKDRES